MWVYLQGWGTGWREFELESYDCLNRASENVGVDTSGLESYVADDGPGQREIEASMTAAQNTGYVGVPHYVFEDPESDRTVGIFGREHLALIRTKYMAAGLARRPDVKAEFSHAWVPGARS